MPWVAEIGVVAAAEIGPHAVGFAAAAASDARLGATTVSALLAATAPCYPSSSYSYYGSYSYSYSYYGNYT